jgi:hypothetical protein
MLYIFKKKYNIFKKKESNLGMNLGHVLNIFQCFCTSNVSVKCGEYFRIHHIHGIARTGAGYSPTIGGIL